MTTVFDHQFEVVSPWTMRGGYGTGRHGTLAERIAATGAGSTAEPPQPPTPQSPARHCRVDGEPSLLVEWRQGRSGWEGRVVSVTWLDAVGWATVERWLPAGDISPS